MEIGSINNSMQLSQLIDSTTSKDPGSFVSYLQNARDKILKEVESSGLSERISQANTAFPVLTAAHGDAIDSVSPTIAGSRVATNATLIEKPIALPEPKTNDPLKQAFEDFVGQTFFAELIKSYRSTQQPAAYFNGGRAEQIFQGQLDQILAEQLSKRSADKIADPMYERFMARRLT